MKVHEYAKWFPALEGEELDALADDIRANGLIQPIILYDNSILDGRNRFRACERAGINPKFQQYKGSDPLGYVISANLHRRHLNESQRAMVAAKMATMPQGARTDLASIEARSQSEAAKALDVGRASVQRAAEVRANGTPELVRAVEKGEIPVSTAAKIARSPSLAPLMSSSSDEWYTPPHIWRAALDALDLDQFDLDPCAEPAKGVAAAMHLTQADDGLAHDWSGAVWMNPPYSEIGDWVDKLRFHFYFVREFEEQNETSDIESFAALVPARTDTAWWRRLTEGPASVVFIDGRLKFGGSGNSAPFPSAVVFAGADVDRVRAAFEGIGSVWRRA